MNGPQTQLEREEDSLTDDLNAGRIDRAEYNEQMRAIHREYRDMAEDAARDAYEAEMSRW